MTDADKTEAELELWETPTIDWTGITAVEGGPGDADEEALNFGS